MSEFKGCSTCKHEANHYKEEPCKGCRLSLLGADELRWEPKEVRTGKEPSESLIQDDYVVVKKEEKKMDNRKTKAQLIEELEQKNAEIVELKKELKKSESYEQCVEAGRAIRESIDGLVEGGLTEDQAFQVVIAAAGMNTKRFW